MGFMIELFVLVGENALITVIIRKKILTIGYSSCCDDFKTICTRPLFCFPIQYIMGEVTRRVTECSGST